MERCRFFAKGGRCTRGASCVYLHDKIEVLEPCRFFAKSGYCDRGNDCFYPHIRSSIPERKAAALNGNANGFQPMEGTIGSSLVGCRFFANGFCRNGNACPFEHYSDSNNNPGQHENQSSTCSRNLNGAQVIFGPGAAVSCVNLVTDFSAVQIVGLTLNSPSVEILQDLLSDLGFSVSLKKFRLKRSKDDRVVVEIKQKDPNFAKNLICKFNEEVVRGGSQQIDIKQIQLNSSNGSLALSRFRRTTYVLCSWQKATCDALLAFRDQVAAYEAYERLRGHGKIKGRSLKLSMSQIPYLSRYGSIIRVENLDPLTKPIHFTSLLHGTAKPNDIQFGEPRHSRSDAEAEAIVRKKLESQQGMQSWEPESFSDGMIATALARFQSKDDGIRAIGNLDGLSIEQLGDSQLSLRHVICFTVSLPVLMLRALEKEVSKWKSEVIKHDSGVQVKIFPPAHNSQFSTLRISGEDVKAVARAKSMLEALLSGTLMEGYKSVLWDPYFTTIDGLKYTEELQTSFDVYIHCDASKRQIRVHGTPRSVALVRGELYRKVQHISESSYAILLTPELLRKALSGTYEAISTRLGKSSVTLDISQQPMSMKINGSTADYQLALDLLQVNTATTTTTTKPNPKSKETCVVCLGEAEDPFSTRCSHTYCKECFINQCNAATDTSFPIQCHGSSSKCTSIFSIPSLQNLLPSPDFERLLERSFITHIQIHSSKFRYCPTPDCSQIYRISTTTADLDCANCLSSICTRCASTCHEGITCADNREIRAGYVQAFDRFKAEHDIRDCSRCKTSIDKIDGCNHVKCGGCNAHICWFCMGDFDSAAETYRHMDEIHKSNG